MKNTLKMIEGIKDFDSMKNTTEDRFFLRKRKNIDYKNNKDNNYFDQSFDEHSSVSINFGKSKKNK